MEALRADPTRQLTAAEIEIFAIFHAPGELTQKEWDRLTMPTPGHQQDYLRRFKCSSEMPPEPSNRLFVAERVSDPEWYPPPFIWKCKFYCWWCRRSPRTLLPLFRALYAKNALHNALAVQGLQNNDFDCQSSAR